MKILKVESIYGNDIKKVKTRKAYKCDCCDELKPAGTEAIRYKCANSNDFFELKFCLDCNDNKKFKVETSW